MPVTLAKERPVTLEIQNITFKSFSSDEISKFSVCNVTNPVSFDSLGNTTRGGLYDNRMGPVLKRELCGTCNKDRNTCEGHFGRIEMVMKCYNPFFMKTAATILKSICTKCKKLQLTDRMKDIVALELQLIDAGFVSEAADLEEQKLMFCNVSKHSSREDTENDVGKREKTYSKTIKKMKKLLDNYQNDYLSLMNHNNNKTKTSEALRNATVNSAMGSAFSSSTRTKCIHCQHPLKKIRYTYKKFVLSLTKKELDDIKNKNLNEENDGMPKSSFKVIMASECREIMKEIFENDGEFLKVVYPVLQSVKSEAFEVFFLDVMPVIPPLWRPPNEVRDVLAEHPQTKAYQKVVQLNNELMCILKVKKTIDETDQQLTFTDLQQEIENVYKLSQGATVNEKIYFKWEELQAAVDMTLDKEASISKYSSDNSVGIKQLIEKKQGLIRMHMMGKRVNYAARTVITPDPNMDVDCFGIPETFATKLTYPVPVTPWNVKELRKMVLNGPDKHPGACFIESTSTGIKRVIPKEANKREGMAATLLKPERNDGMKIVHRHLLNGDVLLLNRQPTLHRPSIMAHKARILKGEKTFKLHYSNCKSYNADFDGDEMNAHFPQNEVGRSEAYNLVGVPHHYLVPKDGTPLGGLIQDHMISGVKMSMRGRFFSREDYHQLVFQGLTSKPGNVKLLPPTILKPYKLWSGKQIFSTLILNIIPDGKPPINLKSTAKLGANLWTTSIPRKWKHGGTELKGNDMTEAEVIIRGGELLVGVLDKNHYGATPYSLIHCIYELYGGDVSTKLLSALTRVFTVFLQWQGFTLGVHDILVTAKADEKRAEIIEESRKVGRNVTCQVLDVDENISNEDLATKLEQAYTNDPKLRTVLDRKYKSAMDVFTNDINKTCLPAGLVCKFPSNNLQLMVMSGAKGSTVNTMQISCLLGQIELEGKRPPLMINGKALPSFPIFECSPKSGGFIDGRFMTGIEPQGFLFHCMAGREGLIDTAVKTSRSGYLQRCLIKHMEGLSVNYDGTVRDSDKSIVQFSYGEDGMDILKSQFLKSSQMQFLADNKNAILDENTLDALRNTPEEDENIKKLKKKVKSHEKKYGNAFLFKHSRDNSIKKYPVTVASKYPPHRYLGAVSECAENILTKYLKDSLDADEDGIRDMFYVKNMRSLAEPGEPVGLLAAQSIGEPSTQMTLNTFHFAGRGDMNVTLGIPRLREILMMASKAIKTPSMEIPFLNQFSDNIDKTADKFRIRLNQVTMFDVLHNVNVKSYITLRPSRTRNYELTFNFLPRSAYNKQFMVKPRKIVKFTHEVFLLRLFKLIERASKDSGEYIETDEKEKKSSKKKSDEGDDEDGQVEDVVKDLLQGHDRSDDENNMDDEDATADIRKSKQMDECDYDEPEDDDEKRDAEESDDEKPEESDDEFDLSKVKLEMDDDNIFANKLQQIVNENPNADVEQLEELEKKEEKDLEVGNEEDIVKLLWKKTSNICSNIVVKEFTVDRKKYLWCSVKFEVPIKFRNIDLTNLMHDAARKAVIWEVPKLKRAITFKQNDLLCIKTEGINIDAMLQYDKILDLNKLYTNDIHAIANTYGIEAAARVVVKEVQNVFKVYGITVDPRHLSLIADYMTFDGTFKPLNRKGIESSASPFQQVSFESALTFLKNAAAQGRVDNVDSPSACLIAGQPCKIGTGSFGLINDLSYALKG